MEQRHRYALLLSGGGARAAYQVGVLKAITSFLPRNHSIPFPIICGNSAGAINATALACYASCYHLGIRKLEWVWKNFHTKQVYEAGYADVFGYTLLNLFMRLRTVESQKRATSLLNNAPLRRLIRRTLDFKRIDRNILTGHLRAVSVTASSYTSHDSIAFFQGNGSIDAWSRQHRRGVPCILDTEHLMASSAIPMVFPPVKMNNEFLGDGSVHQLSPLSTPIHLGAEKILIVGVEQPESVSRFSDMAHFPGSASIAGHLLDTIFADTLHADLERLERVNNTLSILSPKQQSQTGLKSVQCLLINPSIGFNEMAARHFHRMPSGIKAFLRMIGAADKSDATLLSYLLFEKEFCKELIDLGYQDGCERQDELREFLAV